MCLTITHTWHEQEEYLSTDSHSLINGCLKGVEPLAISDVHALGWLSGLMPASKMHIAADNPGAENNRSMVEMKWSVNGYISCRWLLQCPEKKKCNEKMWIRTNKMPGTLHPLYQSDRFKSSPSQRCPEAHFNPLKKRSEYESLQITTVLKLELIFITFLP